MRTKGKFIQTFALSLSELRDSVLHILLYRIFKVYLQKSSLSCYLVPTAILIATLLFTTSVSAQPFWLEQTNNNFIAIEVLKPKFAERESFSFLSAAYYLSGGFRLSQKLVLVGTLPVAHGGIRTLIEESRPELGFYEASETVIGDPYIGVQFHRAGATRFVEIGVWIPLLFDLNFPVSPVARSADYDRREAFVTAPTISGKLNYRHKNESNFVLLLRGGATIFFPETDRSEISIDSSIQAGYEGTRVRITGGLSSRFVVTTTEEGTIHTLGGSISYGFGSMRPGIHLRIVRGQHSFWVSSGDTVDYVFGLNFLAQLH